MNGSALLTALSNCSISVQWIVQSSRTSTVCYLGCVSMWTGKWVWVFHHSSMFLHVGECMGKCVDECVGECMGECAGECVGECVLHFVWMGVSSPVWRRIWICQCVSPVVCDMVRVPLPLFVSVSESATSPHHLIFIIFIISWSYDLMISWSHDLMISSCEHAIMSSCDRVIMSSCRHVIMSSCHHVVIKCWHAFSLIFWDFRSKWKKDMESQELSSLLIWYDVA